ncbi:MAG: prolyl oligopeptidase family serine peptidase [Phycisphaerae bacterium]
MRKDKDLQSSSCTVRPHSGLLVLLMVGPAVLVTLCAGCAVPQKRGAGKLERIVEPTTKRGYWLYLPKDYVAADESARRDRRWPLVVTFHGMKPFDNARPQACEWQQEADRYGFIVVAPELRAFHVLGQFPLRTVNSAFRSDEAATLAILDHVFQNTHADPSNVLSTSWSSGGYMAHYMLNRHPDRFTCLAVRQSNFSASVLDPDATKRSPYHPILILNTQNDFAVCKRESKEARQWYETHGYKNNFWVLIKDSGHERTPDLAAYFFGRVSGTQPNSPPDVLVRRQAIDGNEEGIAFLLGKLSGFQSPPGSRLASRAELRTRPETPPRNAGSRGPARGAVAHAPADARPGNVGAATRARTAAVPRRIVRRSPLKIGVSSAIGIEPLHLGFWADCPASWRETADFLWTLDGQPIGNGVNGQRTLAEAGEHTLGVLAITAQGEEYRATRTIRVLPRLDAVSSAARRTSQ